MWDRRLVFLIAAVVSLSLAASAVVFVVSSNAPKGLFPFHSYAEMSSFLDGARNSLQSGRMGTGLFSAPANTPTPGAPNAGTTGGAPSYSGTNVQVAGVDELDMVKTDGTYIYIASQSEVDVVLAYPATSMRVVSRIPVANLTKGVFGANTTAWASGLFLEGPRLVVVAQTYDYGRVGLYGGVAGPTSSMQPMFYPAAEQTVALLFDVTDPAQPVLLHTLSVTGSPSTGRMVNGTVYLVATQWIFQVNGTYVVPQVCVDGACANLSAGQIYHDPQSQDSYDYTNLLSIDLATAESRAMAVVTGGFSVFYMSPTAMYLAFYKWAASPVPYMTTFMPVQVSDGWTTIYKLEAAGLDITAVASGDVLGTLQSPYSMDEWHGYLRVATTERTYTNMTVTTSNGVYVFDPSMRLVGSVRGLAPGESIFAVRFVEDRAYVVTFRKIDPLFVIDLSNPAAPSVSGFLEMPGFSTYLYPLDPGHLVGLGKNAVSAAEGNWSWYQGLKLSLYNVTDPTAPSEAANVTLGDRGSDSAALYDPHAFLYIPGREYVVVPVDLAVINASQYPNGVPDWAWGTIVWQGAYVFHVNATTGITTVGRVAHGNGTVNSTCGWYDSSNEIRRSLYIGDVLYTISGTEVLASSLADLAPISSVTYAPSVSGYSCPGPLTLV